MGPSGTESLVARGVVSSQNWFGPKRFSPADVSLWPGKHFVFNLKGALFKRVSGRWAYWGQFGNPGEGE